MNRQESNEKIKPVNEQDHKGLFGESEQLRGAQSHPKSSKKETSLTQKKKDAHLADTEMRTVLSSLVFFVAEILMEFTA